MLAYGRLASCARDPRVHVATHLDFPQGKLVIVAMPGIQGEVEPPRVFVGMWSLDDNGDVAPKWTIRGDQTTLKKPFAVALNPDHKEIFVTDMRLNGVMTFSVPEVFEPVTR